MEMKIIDEEIKDDIIDLHFNYGLYAYEISEILNVSRPIIYDVIKKYKEQNNLDFVIGTISRRENKNYVQNILNIPPDLLKDLEFTKENKRVCLFVDKNKDEKQIVIKKPKE